MTNRKPFAGADWDYRHYSFVRQSGIPRGELDEPAWVAHGHWLVPSVCAVCLALGLVIAVVWP
jgi:hypothetical protein